MCDVTVDMSHASMCDSRTPLYIFVPSCNVDFLLLFLIKCVAEIIENCGCEMIIPKSSTLFHTKSKKVKNIMYRNFYSVGHNFMNYWV